MGFGPRVDLPREAVDLYRSGATIAAVASAYGRPYCGTRNALNRAGAIRERVPNRTPIEAGNCRYCGQDLDHPHILGAHLPGCQANATSP